MAAVRDFYHDHQVRNLSPISSKDNLNREEPALVKFCQVILLKTRTYLLIDN
ncbi:MAG: hypothetical protein RLZZ338_344 [Cyanobacteriota bacterium]|jgi:hypothetical protein